MVRSRGGLCMAKQIMEHCHHCTNNRPIGPATVQRIRYVGSCAVLLLTTRQRCVVCTLDDGMASPYSHVPLTVSPVQVSVPLNQCSVEHRQAPSGSCSSSPSLRISYSRRLTRHMDNSSPIHSLLLFDTVDNTKGTQNRIQKD